MSFVDQPAPSVVGSTSWGLAAPAQLPAAATAFTGRSVQLEELDAVLLGRRSPLAPGVTVAVITGGAGVGKTALAVCWGHRVCDRFPDGQLFVPLRVY